MNEIGKNYSCGRREGVYRDRSTVISSCTPVIQTRNSINNQLIIRNVLSGFTFRVKVF